MIRQNLKYECFCKCGKKLRIKHMKLNSVIECDYCKRKFRIIQDNYNRLGYVEVDNMDIQVKYKEVDKKAKVEKILENPIARYSPKIVDYLIDAIYNDENDIESATIKGDAYKIKVIPRNVRGRACISTYDYDRDGDVEASIHIDYTKQELAQYIDILQKIHAQMEG